MIDQLDPRDAAVARLLAGTPMNSDPQDLERALTAYRNSRAFRGRRLPRHALRLGTVGLVTVFTGSLAAGYAAALPDPVQRVAHHLLAHVGVPAPSHKAAQQPETHARPTPTAPMTPGLHHASRQHDVRATAIGDRPPLTLTTDPQQIVGSHALARVRVADVGASNALVDVRLQWATTRGGPWHPLRARRVPNRHDTLFSLPAFTVNTWVRAADGSAVSRARLVTVIPTLTATWSRTADGHLQLRLVARGGSPGDAISVVDLSQRRPASEPRSSLDTHGDAVFTFANSPPAGDLLMARLAATSRHGATHVALRVPFRH